MGWADQLSRTVEAAMNKAIRGVVSEIYHNAKEIVNIPATRTSRGWESSAPGEPPRRRSGKLRRSIKKQARKPTLTSIAHWVYVDRRIAKYALWVNDGTSRMAPRPYKNPAIRSAGDIGKNIKQRFNRIIREKAANNPDLDLEDEEL